MRAAHDTEWQTIDQTLLGLAARAGDLDAEIGRWLIVASRENVHRHFAYPSFAEYAERRFGFKPRDTRERLRVAEALESLPAVRSLLASGERSWSAVREITRVATPENESTWVASTERLTVRQIERMVAGRKPGDDPIDAKDPLLTPRRLVFNLESERLAEWREAGEAMRKVIGAGASDDEVFRAMCEMALGQRDETVPGYQIKMTVCTRCDRTWRQAGGDAIEVPPSVGERAACDGEVVGFACVDEGIAEPEEATHVDPLPAAISEILQKAGPRGLVRAISSSCGMNLRTFHRATRKRIALRDNNRCTVPGCTNTRFIDGHHLVPRSKGGKHNDDQVASLCKQHHDAAHDSRLVIKGKPSTGLTFFDARGEIYGSRPTWVAQANEGT